MQMFGYPLTPAEFTPGAASHLHPDDIPLMQHRINHLMNSDRSGVVDLRIANSEGRYLWCRLRAKVIRNASGEPERITAILYDIDELKRDALAMRKQAERDSLTKLLNKASAQQQITEYLSGRAPNSNAALLVMDLDNFKSINDCDWRYQVIPNRYMSIRWKSNDNQWKWKYEMCYFNVNE